jgi:hypothetical protein
VGYCVRINLAPNRCSSHTRDKYLEEKNTGQLTVVYPCYVRMGTRPLRSGRAGSTKSCLLEEIAQSLFPSAEESDTSLNTYRVFAEM